MRILLANYRYFVSGGPERYMFNLTDALAARDHEVIPFSVGYARNRPTKYSRYFAEPLGNINDINFVDQTLHPHYVWRTIRRLFYDPSVERTVARLVEDTRPQIAYVLKYLNKLSPGLLVGLKKSGIPVVVRLSDYDMLCPQAHCERRGIPCELCVHGNVWYSIRYRCVQGSLIASSMRAFAAWYHRSQRYFDLIDVVVTTTQFMYDLLVSAGFARSRLRLIPTFVDGSSFRPVHSAEKGDYIAYAGRLEKNKGLHVLLDAIALICRTRQDLDFTLKVAGSGTGMYVSSLRETVNRLGLQTKVQFLGHLDIAELSSFLARARLVVVPSLWYENLPNCVLESYACGTPVLASDLGSLRECVLEGKTGSLFHPGNAKSLADRLEYCLDKPDRIGDMAHQARDFALNVYSPNRHITMLEEVFHGLVD